MHLPLAQRIVMVKRTVLLISLAVLVLVMSIIGYFQISDQAAELSPYQAMSSEAVSVLVVNNYERAFGSLVYKSLMWQDLLGDKDLARVNESLVRLDSIIRSVDDAEEYLEDLKIHIAFYPHGSKDFSHCMILPIHTQQEAFMSDIMEKVSLSQKTYGVFEEIEVMEVEIRDKILPKLYVARVNNLLILAFSPDMAETAVRAIHQGKSLEGDKAFTSVSHTTGEFADWNFFVNYGSAGGMRIMGIDAGAFANTDIRWSGWAALDATLHPDLVLFNGFTYAPESSFLSLFEKQRSQDIDAIEIIPDDAALFFHFGVSHYKDYSKRKRAYFKSLGKLKKYKEKLEKLQGTYGIDLEGELDSWVANEFGVCYTDGEGNADASKVVYFRLSDKKRAEQFIASLTSQSDEAGRLPIAAMFDDIETELFKGLNKPYYDFLDKYLILSGNKNSIRHLKDKYQKAQTLQKSESYSELTSNMSDQSNVYVYVHLKKGLPIYTRIMGKSALAFFYENAELLGKFEHLGIQFKDGKRNMFYQHTSLDYHGEKRAEGNTLWEARLDTISTMKPAIVYNHYTNAREIFIQDVSNVIYLIDNKGNVIWKRQLKEPIMSEVHQIDVYKNNKLQLLFSGESSIYLIDRKGRDVENFPVQLPAVTTNGLAVIDYEKNREYRILVGVRGGKVLNFDRSGKEIKGWNFKCNEEVVSPIRHFVIGGKDYITFVGSDGNPFVVNRRGDIRIPIKNSLPGNTSSQAVLDLSNDINQCRFLTTDESGNVIKLKFSGEKEIINFESFSSRHEFLYGDINGDRKPDYVFLDSNRLLAFDHSKEKLFETTLTDESATYLSLFQFGEGEFRLGLTDTTSAQVMLFNEVGNMDTSFPLKGDSPFTISDINKDDRFNLIVCMGSKLLAYNLE